MSEPLQVFIMGPARSGTSVTYHAMRAILGLPGDGEGHVLPIFVKLMHQYKLYLDEFKGQDGKVLAAKLDLRSFRTVLESYMKDFYTKEYPDGAFVDKTPGPEAIIATTFIVEAFPNAKMLVTRRSGVEVVNSFRRKFQSNFEDGCVAWAATMEVMSDLTARYPQMLCVDQFDLANRPAEAAGLITEHLGVPDRADAFARFFEENGEDRKSTHAWDHRLTAEEAGWSGGETETFTRICGELMQHFGYPI